MKTFRYSYIASCGTYVGGLVEATCIAEAFDKVLKLGDNDDMKLASVQVRPVPKDTHEVKGSIDPWRVITVLLLMGVLCAWFLFLLWMSLKSWVN